MKYRGDRLEHRAVVDERGHQGALLHRPLFRRGGALTGACSFSMPKYAPPRPASFSMPDCLYFCIIVSPGAYRWRPSIRVLKSANLVPKPHQPWAACAMMKEQLKALCLSLLPWLGPLVYRDEVTLPLSPGFDLVY